MNYTEFFHQATGRQPYPYQVRLATEPWPDLLDIPTGLGKTAAVTLAWLWKRHQAPSDTPRRLIYCLPMRVLVQQTCGAVEGWLTSLRPLLGESPSKVHVLMGGEADQTWDAQPDQPAVLIGTQDMLLSRALNRGYGMSRYRWPIHFAQMNNDCLWLFDETQLMGVSVETSAQLDGLRARFGTLLPTRSLWMSATLQREQLETVDHQRPATGWQRAGLENADLQDTRVLERTQAVKSLEQAPIVVNKAGKATYPSELARWVKEQHQPGTLTLVVLNTVDRAQEISGALRKLKVDHSLLHSRFRPAERRLLEERLPDLKEGILISTQVVEAGVDLSSRLLVTELAPWSSMVQRFGRCNRYGDQPGARVVWIDVQDMPLPYESADLELARDVLTRLPDASLTTLRDVRVETPLPVRPILRARDLIDLFDTTPDLSGGDIDVSMYIRENEDVDVQVYWRDLPSSGPNDRLSAAHRNELCSVPVGSFRDFPKDRDVWTWDGLRREFVEVKPGDVRPGRIYLVRTTAGGYDLQLGWIGVKAKGVVPAVSVVSDVPEAGMGGDGETCVGRWVALDEHLRDVAGEAERVGRALGLETRLVTALSTAGRWHDVGKAHEAFQTALRKTAGAMAVPPGLQAKSAMDASRLNYETVSGPRPGFRHELASALAWLQKGRDDDLVAYLIAAHHGKVRLSIRSMPNEEKPVNEQRRFARGVWDGDILPPVDGLLSEATSLDLEPMQLGEGSWLSRMLALRDQWGPFRLALLESLVRTADWKASDMERRALAEASV